MVAPVVLIYSLTVKIAFSRHDPQRSFFFKKLILKDRTSQTLSIAQRKIHLKNILITNFPGLSAWTSKWYFQKKENNCENFLLLEIFIPQIHTIIIYHVLSDNDIVRLSQSFVGHDGRHGSTIAQHHKVNLKRLPIVHKHALSSQMQLSLTNGVAQINVGYVQSCFVCRKR